jgi:hypothetical protein
VRGLGVTASLQEFKAHLSEWLARAQAGEAQPSPLQAAALLQLQGPNP